MTSIDLFKILRLAYSDCAWGVIRYIFDVYEGDKKDLFFIDENLEIFNIFIEILNNNDIFYNEYGSNEAYGLITFLLENIDNETSCLLNTPTMKHDFVDPELNLEKSTVLERVVTECHCSDEHMYLVACLIDCGALISCCVNLNEMLLNLAVNNNSAIKNYAKTSNDYVEFYFKLIGYILLELKNRHEKVDSKVMLYAERNNDIRLVELLKSN